MQEKLPNIRNSYQLYISSYIIHVSTIFSHIEEDTYIYKYLIRSEVEGHHSHNSVAPLVYVYPTPLTVCSNYPSQSPQALESLQYYLESHADSDNEEAPNTST